jgi:hypothetical protein
MSPCPGKPPTAGERPAVMPSELPEPSPTQPPAPTPGPPPTAETLCKAMATSDETERPLDYQAFLAAPLSPDELGWLAHYRVLKLLGRGGMGAVFQAQGRRTRGCTSGRGRCRRRAATTPAPSGTRSRGSRTTRPGGRSASTRPPSTRSRPPASAGSMTPAASWRSTSRPSPSWRSPSRGRARGRSGGSSSTACTSAGAAAGPTRGH